MSCYLNTGNLMVKPPPPSSVLSHMQMFTLSCLLCLGVTSSLFVVQQNRWCRAPVSIGLSGCFTWGNLPKHWWKPQFSSYERHVRSCLSKYWMYLYTGPVPADGFILCWHSELTIVFMCVLAAAIYMNLKKYARNTQQRVLFTHYYVP